MRLSRFIKRSVRNIYSISKTQMSLLKLNAAFYGFPFYYCLLSNQRYKICLLLSKLKTTVCFFKSGIFIYVVSSLTFSWKCIFCFRNRPLIENNVLQLKCDIRRSENRILPYKKYRFL